MRCATNWCTAMRSGGAPAQWRPTQPSSSSATLLSISRSRPPRTRGPSCTRFRMKSLTEGTELNGDIGPYQTILPASTAASASEVQLIGLRLARKTLQWCQRESMTTCEDSWTRSPPINGIDLTREDYRRLIPALARANPAPPPLDSDLKREMYVHYYAQENGINLRFLAGISDLAVVSDLASQLNRSGLSFKDLAKQKNGPKLEDAILVVNSALQEAGMDDRAPIGPASFNLGPDGNLADESQRDKWVLAGALEVTLQTPPGVSAPGQAPTYRTIVKMKPTRKGEQEYELHGLEPAMLKQGFLYRWDNLPIGDLIVEITKPDGTIARREVTLEKQETILPVQLEPVVSKVWICEKPKVRGGTVWGPYEEEGKFLPALSGTATSASFTDPEGKHSGSAKWSALPESLREGQEVRITMSAMKMRVSMNWPTGSKRSSYGVADLPELYPGRNSLDTSFKFQPGPGKAKFQVSVLAQPTYTAFSDAFGVYVTCEYRLAE